MFSCARVGFNIGSAGTSVAATGAQSTPVTAANSTTTSATGAGAAVASSKPVVSTGRRDVSLDVCNVPGFTVLQWLLSQHPHIPHVYFMMMALLVGQPVQPLPQDIQVQLYAMAICVFSNPQCQLSDLTNFLYQLYRKKTACSLAHCCINRRSKAAVIKFNIL